MKEMSQATKGSQRSHGFASKPLASTVDHISFLQQHLGNQAVQRLYKAGSLQPTLKIGRPDDVYEQEADRVAERVMRMEEPSLAGKCDRRGSKATVENTAYKPQGAGIQRKKVDPADPNKTLPITGTDVKFTGGLPGLTGSTKADPSGQSPGNTRIYGPHMKVSSTVELSPGVKLKDDLVVGYIQTTPGCDRVSVYTDNGLPTGNVLAEDHSTIPQGSTQDATTHAVQNSSGQFISVKGKLVVERNVSPPWFDYIKLVPASGQPVQIDAQDLPSFAVPFEKQVGSVRAKLARTRGSDTFKTSLAIKDGAETPIHLVAGEWSVDWTTTIDPSQHTGTGNPSAVTPIHDPSKLDEGKGLAHDDAIDWEAPQNDAQADAIPAPRAISWLPIARQTDNAAYERIAKALRKSNPASFRATVFVDKDDRYIPFKGDIVVVTMQGNRPEYFRQKEVTTGNSFNADFRLFDLFDPNDISVGTTIKVTIRKQGEVAKSEIWSFPFAEKQCTYTFSGASKYRMQLSLV